MQAPDPSHSFGQLLRRYRVAARLTQEALAERAGLGLRSVQAWESGARLPLGASLDALSQALGVLADHRTRLRSAAQPPPRRRNPPVPGRDGRPRPPAGHPALAVPNNLPIQWTSFVGREQPIRDLLELLESTPLLTLTGTGGCGKTRLAIEVAERLAGGYSDGVWLIELAPLTDPSRIAPTMAATIGVPEVLGEPILQTLTRDLRAKRVLLVVDNCEHLIDGAARAVDALLRSCPGVRVLTTSREPLRLTGEVSWRVPSLALPPTTPVPVVEDVLQVESVRLFAERARAVVPGFAVTSQNAAAVAQVCQRLDGIPLALELAAARLAGLSVQQLAARLDQRFRLLTGGSPAALPRQQTLAALVAWSYDLLNEQEQTLFDRLALFVGGFTLEAAEGVCAGGEIDAIAVLDLLLRLVEKSLVIAEPGDDGVERYRLLETLRQYAREKLAARGEVDAVRGRHGTYYLELARQAGTERRESRLPLWSARMRLEMNNIEAGVRWAIDAADVEHALSVCGALADYLSFLAQPGESRRFLAELLALPAAAPPTVGRGRVLLNGGWLAWNQLDLDQADALLDEALTILRTCGDQSGIGTALGHKARVATFRGDCAGARALAEEASAIARATGDPAVVQWCLGALGEACFYLGDYPMARSCVEESLAARGAAPPFQGPWLDWLGHIATAGGDYATARARYAEGMRQRLAIDRKIGVAFTLSGLAGLAAAQGELRRAVRLSGVASLLCELSGLPSHRTQEGYIRDRLPGIRAALGAAAYDAAWAEGRAMTLEQAVAYALKEASVESTV